MGWDWILKEFPLVVTLVRIMFFRPRFFAISLRTPELPTTTLPKVTPAGAIVIEEDGVDWAKVRTAVATCSAGAKATIKMSLIG